jgi:crotonobetainyl-CoA:carnitine CoA-transferase CaiB-like acyl-CoA transferase
MSETPGSEKGDPPALGEANNEILSRAGIDEKEIVEINSTVEAARASAIAALSQLNED